MPTYRVLLTASAAVHGYAHVIADTPQQAPAKALKVLGDVEWTYDGVDDSTVEAVEVVATSSE